MTPHAIARAAWAAGMLAVFALPEAWRAPSWIGLTVAFGALVVWGVVSIRSPYFGRALSSGRDEAAVALTFDDGPDPDATPALLELLRQRGVAATFFVVGERVRAHPDLVRRCAAAGHEIGNHSDRHSLLLNFRLPRGMTAELGACQETLERVLGSPAAYYRPPVGLRNPAVHRACARLGLTVVGWQVRGLDRSRRAPARVADRILRRLRPGGIVLLHDGGQGRERLLEITSAVLDGLDRRGLRPVALTRLLRGDGAPAGVERAAQA